MAAAEGLSQVHLFRGVVPADAPRNPFKNVSQARVTPSGVMVVEDGVRLTLLIEGQPARCARLAQAAVDIAVQGDGERAFMVTSDHTLVMFAIAGPHVGVIHSPTVPPSCATEVLQVACGLRHAVVLTMAGLFGLGARGDPCLGLGSVEEGSAPLAEDLETVHVGRVLLDPAQCIAGGSVLKVACGGHASFAVVQGTCPSSGHWGSRVFSWGVGVHLGLAEEASKVSTPAELIDLHDEQVVHVAASVDHAIACTIDGSCFSWGEGSSGQLGEQVTGHRPRPARMDLGSCPVVDGACSKGITLVVVDTSDSMRYCSEVFVWGGAEGNTGWGGNVRALSGMGVAAVDALAGASPMAAPSFRWLAVSEGPLCQRNCAIRELIATERAFRSSLRALVSVYLEPLGERLRAEPGPATAQSDGADLAEEVGLAAGPNASDLHVLDELLAASKRMLGFHTLLLARLVVAVYSSRAALCPSLVPFGPSGEDDWSAVNAPSPVLLGVHAVAWAFLAGRLYRVLATVHTQFAALRQSPEAELMLRRQSAFLETCESLAAPADAGAGERGHAPAGPAPPPASRGMDLLLLDPWRRLGQYPLILSFIHRYGLDSADVAPTDWRPYAARGGVMVAGAAPAADGSQSPPLRRHGLSSSQDVSNAAEDSSPHPPIDPAALQILSTDLVCCVPDPAAHGCGRDGTPARGRLPHDQGTCCAWSAMSAVKRAVDRTEVEASSRSRFEALLEALRPTNGDDEATALAFDPARKLVRFSLAPPAGLRRVLWGDAAGSRALGRPASGIVVLFSDRLVLVQRACEASFADIVRSRLGSREMGTGARSGPSAAEGLPWTVSVTVLLGNIIDVTPAPQTTNDSGGSWGSAMPRWRPLDREADHAWAPPSRPRGAAGSVESALHIRARLGRRPHGLDGLGPGSATAGPEALFRLTLADEATASDWHRQLFHMVATVRGDLAQRSAVRLVSPARGLLAGKPVQLPGGALYWGGWSDGAQEGFGVCAYTNGDRYSGAWRGGLPDGLGRLERADGDVFHAIFARGVRAGPGFVRRSTGAWLAGEWHGGRLRGRAVLGSADEVTVCEHAMEDAAGRWFLTLGVAGGAGVDGRPRGHDSSLPAGGRAALFPVGAILRSAELAEVVRAMLRVLAAYQHACELHPLGGDYARLVSGELAVQDTLQCYALCAVRLPELAGSVVVDANGVDGAAHGIPWARGVLGGLVEELSNVGIGDEAGADSPGHDCSLRCAVEGAWLRPLETRVVAAVGVGLLAVQRGARGPVDWLVRRRLKALRGLDDGLLLAHLGAPPPLANPSGSSPGQTLRQVIDERRAAHDRQGHGAPLPGPAEAPSLFPKAVRHLRVALGAMRPPSERTAALLRAYRALEEGMAARHEGHGSPLSLSADVALPLMQVVLMRASQDHALADLAALEETLSRGLVAMQGGSEEEYWALSFCMAGRALECELCGQATTVENASERIWAEVERLVDDPPPPSSAEGAALLSALGAVRTSRAAHLEAGIDKAHALRALVKAVEAAYAWHAPSVRAPDAALTEMETLLLSTEVECLEAAVAASERCAQSCDALREALGATRGVLHDGADSGRDLLGDDEDAAMALLAVGDLQRRAGALHAIFTDQVAAWRSAEEELRELLAAAEELRVRSASPFQQRPPLAHRRHAWAHVRR